MSAVLLALSKWLNIIIKLFAATYSVTSLDLRLDGREFDSRQLQLILWLMSHEWPSSAEETTSVFHRATQANSASYPQPDGKWVPVKVRWCSAAAGGGVKSGWFIPYKWINVWLAGKTVWSFFNTCQPERFRDEHRTHREALYNVLFTLLYVVISLLVLHA